MSIFLESSVALLQRVSSKCAIGSNPDQLCRDVIRLMAAGPAPDDAKFICLPFLCVTPNIITSQRRKLFKAMTERVLLFLSENALGFYSGFVSSSFKFHKILLTLQDIGLT